MVSQLHKFVRQPLRGRRPGAQRHERLASQGSGQGLLGPWPAGTPYPHTRITWNQDKSSAVGGFSRLPRIHARGKPQFEGLCPDERWRFLACRPRPRRAPPAFPAGRERLEGFFGARSSFSTPVSKPSISRRWIEAPIMRSVARTQPRSSLVTKVHAIPSSSARPVRPMRCV